MRPARVARPELAREQIVVHTGHAVQEDDPDLVIDVILDVVGAAGS